jgi:NAD(P)-dependent dehydrogenase (short-subunit alcohol dehydrogenase family)
MKDFMGKIAVITGGASGAGLGQAKVFAKAGMKVAIADKRLDALHNAVNDIVGYAGCKVNDVLPLHVDLTNRQAYIEAANDVEKIFGGPPHLLLQTAGVNTLGPSEAATFDDYDWIMSVCLDHVVNGLLIFVPRMIKAYGGKDGTPKEEFHIATTSSMAAFMPCSGATPYAAAKAAVNNLMYSYSESMGVYGAGVTVLCPGNIRSDIFECEAYRPEHLRSTGNHVSEGVIMTLRNFHLQGLDPIELAEILKEGIENGRVFVLPFKNHDEWYPILRAAHEVVEDYLLTSKEREEKLKNKKAPDYTMPVPEGGEPVGLARADLDYIAEERRMKKF